MKRDNTTLNAKNKQLEDRLDQLEHRLGKLSERDPEMEFSNTSGISEGCEMRSPTASEHKMKGQLMEQMEEQKKNLSSVDINTRLNVHSSRETQSENDQSQYKTNQEVHRERISLPPLNFGERKESLDISAVHEFHDPNMTMDSTTNNLIEAVSSGVDLKELKKRQEEHAQLKLQVIEMADKMLAKDKWLEE